jgi:hypothetical protein
MNKEKQPKEVKDNGLYTLLDAGQKVTLDADLSNDSVVWVIKQTPKRMYTTVTNGKGRWEVMTYRLTPCT